MFLISDNHNFGFLVITSMINQQIKTPKFLEFSLSGFYQHCIRIDFILIESG